MSSSELHITIATWYGGGESYGGGGVEPFPPVAPLEDDGRQFLTLGILQTPFSLESDSSVWCDKLIQ